MKLKLLSIASLAAVVALGSANFARAGVIDLGTSYSPPGSNLTITAVQGVDASNPLGQSSFTPQVNQNDEFQNGIGVSYQQVDGSGKIQNNLKDSGLGLYQNGGNSPVESTGLNIKFNAPVTASSVNVVLEDFDIKTGTAFEANKVAPSISLFGANGALLGTANPTQFLASNPSFSSINDGTYTLNLGAVLTTLGQSSSSAVSGYLLSADDTQGENNNSDPYFLVSAGQGVPPPPPPTPPPSVPETSTLLPLLGVLGLIIGIPIIRRRFAGLAQQSI